MNKEKKIIGTKKRQMDISVIICRCPICKSENVKSQIIKGITHFEGGTFIQPVTMEFEKELMICDDCGICFNKVKGNGI